jgi:Ca-activated chloride channel family protein
LNFAHPEMLWLLGLVPLLVIWGVRNSRLRQRSWQAIAQRGRPPKDGTFRLIAAVSFTILALSQPRWGLSRSDRLPPGHDVVLLIDASRSMAAEDAVPNRLGVAKESARSLIETLAKSPGNRVGVVAFAGRGVLRCPLTENAGAALDAIDRLRPGDVRPGGTDLAAGLVAAVDAFDRQEHEDGRTIVILSDGEDLVGRWERAMPTDRLRRERVIVHSIAIGDPEKGHDIPVPAAGAGENEATATAMHPLRYRGQPVLSRRDDHTLEAISRRSGGTIIRLGLASVDLGALYSSKIEPVAMRTRAEFRIAERIDRFPIFLAAALTLGLIGCLPLGSRTPDSRAWFRIRRWLRSWARFRPTVVRASIAASAMLAITGAGDASHRQTLESAHRAVGRGLAAYRAGNFSQALAEFQAAINLEPTLAIPRYNAAAARFQLGTYDKARAGYLEARSRAGPALRTKIDFALGNTALASGDFTEAIGHYDACLASSTRGPDLDAVRHDADINRQFAIRQAQAMNAAQLPKPQSKSRTDREHGRLGPDESRSNETGETGEESGETERDEGLHSGEGIRRRTGGKGGAGSRGKSDRIDADSPDRRLDKALENIRDARKRRLPQDHVPPGPETQDDRKDW